jgi:hypothetical protein
MKSKEIKYMVTKEESQKKCDGKVCKKCGSAIVPFETVDNARNPTFWQGCETCMEFQFGTTPEVYKIAKELSGNFHNVSMQEICGIVQGAMWILGKGK